MTTLNNEPIMYYDHLVRGYRCSECKGQVTTFQSTPLLPGGTRIELTPCGHGGDLTAARIEQDALFGIEVPLAAEGSRPPPRAEVTAFPAVITDEMLHTIVRDNPFLTSIYELGRTHR